MEIRAFLLDSKTDTFQLILNNLSDYQVSKNQLIPIDFTWHYIYSDDEIDMFLSDPGPIIVYTCQ